MKRTNFDKNKNRITVHGIKKFILFTVAGILVASTVLMTVEVATSSLEISSLRDKSNGLSMEKRNLENILAKSLSVNDLEQKGGEMGYAKPATLVYISGSKEVAVKLP